MWFKKLYENSLIERTINTPKGPLLDADGKPVEIIDNEDDNENDTVVNKKQSKPKDPLAGILLTKNQQEKFESDPTSIIDMLWNGEVKYFEDFKNWNKKLQQKMIDSIVAKGIAYKDNPFLRYVKYIADSPVTKSNNLTSSILSIIEKAAEKDDKSFIYTNKNLKNNKYNMWVKDPNSYKADDPEFKVKTLLFLTSGDVSKYGDTKTVPIDAVKESKKKDEIMTIVSNWQTKNGTKPINTGVEGSGSKQLRNNKSDKLSKIGKISEATKKFINNIGGDKGTITIKRRDLLNYFTSGNIKADDTVNNAYAKMFKKFILTPTQTQQQVQQISKQPQQQQNNKQ